MLELAFHNAGQMSLKNREGARKQSEFREKLQYVDLLNFEILPAGNWAVVWQQKQPSLFTLQMKAHVPLHRSTIKLEVN